MSRTIDNAFKDAIAEGVFPAADLVVAKSGAALYSKHYGDARNETCFDIASLTKPIATASVALKLIAENFLKLDDTVYQWLGGARQMAHRQMTVLNLLNHTAGLPAWQPYFRELPFSMIATETGKQLILDACYNEPLLSEPGRKTLYSDIGYILLGEMVEQAGGEPLDKLFAKYIADPLGLKNTFFVRNKPAPVSTKSKHTTTTADQHVPTPKHGRPEERAERKAGEHRRFASTEDCPWRSRVIHGEVHDQNAFALGGVAGHSGLFSTAEDINLFITEFVKCWNEASNFLPSNIIREYIREEKTRSYENDYVLGWNRPMDKNSASGHCFSPNTIGHLGYTGCSMWIDLKKNFWIILLTNRIHPSTTNEKIKSFRPQIHDLIYDELITK